MIATHCGDVRAASARAFGRHAAGPIIRYQAAIARPKTKTMGYEILRHG